MTDQAKETIPPAVQELLDRHLDHVAALINDLRLDVNTKRSNYETALEEVIKVSNRHNELTREVKDLFIRTTLSTERQIMDVRSETQQAYGQLTTAIGQLSGQISAANIELAGQISTTNSGLSDLKRDLASVSVAAMTSEQVDNIVIRRVSAIGVGIATVIGLIIAVVALAVT